MLSHFRVHPSASKRLLEKLGSADRIADFRHRLAQYEKLPTLENYLTLRLDFPEVEVDVLLFSDTSAIYALKGTLKSQGIDPELVVGAMNGCAPEIDKLCLRLMECLVAKAKLSTDESGFIRRRRSAIDEALVDYLIVLMLEGMGSDPIVIPSSLIVLIRDRLCGPTPDLNTINEARQERENAAAMAARNLKPAEMTSRKLANLTGVSKNKAASWLKKPEFRAMVDDFRKYSGASQSEALVPDRPTKKKRAGHLILAVFARIRPQSEPSENECPY
jgi:hypothetical protein